MGGGVGPMAFHGEEGAWALGGGARQATSGPTAAYSSPEARVRGFLLLAFWFLSSRVNILSKGKLRELWAVQRLGKGAEKLGGRAMNTPCPEWRRENKCHMLEILQIDLKACRWKE